LTIVAWNIHVGGGDVVELVRRLRAGELTNGRAVDHFVLLLQEVHREGGLVPMDAPNNRVPERIAESPPSGERLDVVEIANRVNLDLFYVPSMRNGGPNSGPTEEDRGNAILSTLPLHDLTAIDLPMETFRRVAVAATVRGVSINGSEWSLRVCSTHLSTRTGFPRFFESAGVGRLRQTKALLEALPESPAVLGGDFNTWAPGMLEGTTEFIRERFRYPEELDERPTLAVTLLPDRRVDYLFFDLPDGLTAHYRRLDDLLGSDHYPLLGWVTLSSPVP
jgi:endonuclease/exonuclease/phosphatase family metal-dependent hydrolase